MTSVAVVGATGLVGQKILECLRGENLLGGVNLTLVASEKNCGKNFYMFGEAFVLEALDEKILDRHFDVVFFSAGDEISAAWAKRFAAGGALVIDNSNAFRRESDVPLVVPEINSGKMKAGTKLVANPNCSTIQLAVVLHKLLEVGEIEQVVVSTYQSVSGAGKDALLDLERGTNLAIPEGITGNIIPKIGKIEENGFCTEEDKIMFETKKILEKDFDIVATSVRVPVPYCHGESVYVRFKGEANIDQIKEKLGQSPDYLVFDEHKLFLPTDVAGSNKTFVCRLREVSRREIAFFVVADNLRRGAAYNAVKIFETQVGQKF